MENLQLPNHLRSDGAGPEVPPDGELAGQLRTLRPGIVVLDAPGRRVLFLNETVEAILRNGGLDPTFDSMEALFLVPALAAPAESPLEAHVKGRVVGFSVYGGGPVRWVFCADVTEKLRQVSIAEVSERAALFCDVFSAIRHEVGNPLNSAKTALAVLRRNFDSLSAESVLAYVDRALLELARVEELLRLLRDFAGTRPVSVQPLPLGPLLRDVEAAAARDLLANGISLIVTVSELLEVRADEEALRNVLLSILANSVAALGGRGGGKIMVEAETEGGLVRLRLTDDGPGIPAETMSRLFTPFSGTASGKIGLGLPTARTILARMGGTLEVSSTPGNGATVTISLPAAPGIA